MLSQSRKEIKIEDCNPVKSSFLDKKEMGQSSLKKSMTCKVKESPVVRP
jgi:hypothetical protein